MENSILKRRLAKGASRVFAAMLLIGGPLSWTSCTDDLLTGTPTWLGSSIYEELESRGDFQTTLALINDPDLSETNYPEMLRRTGSLTLFVADDAAWKKYLDARGVSSVNELSKAEKKNLLKGAMINNAYLIELLSNKPGDPPTEGLFMRRSSRVDISDSIPVVLASEMPPYNPARIESDTAGNTSVIDYWSHVRGRANILLYKDNNAPTMVHFTPDFMSSNDIVQQDIQVLTNGACQTTDRSYINGLPVAENDGRWPDKDVNTDGSAKEFLQDITCQNGYIHVLESVPEQLPNMAEIIRTKPQFSIFSSLLERFSYPQFIGMREVEGRSDSIFVKRYFNNGKNAFDTPSDSETPLSSVLTLDPGWNAYCINTTNEQITANTDGAAIFVPTDEWMNYYITQGDGKPIGVKYNYNWDNVPDAIVLPFLNNCMKSSLISSTPSKFDNVKDTQSEPMGLTVDKVDSCFMACNGVVYQMSNVYVAPEHQSVFFPVTLRQDQDLSVMYRFISDTRYKPPTHAYTMDWTGYENQAYVNSMASTYSFLLPKDEAFTNIIDPYGIYEQNLSNKKPVAYRYYIDSQSKNFPVSAEAFVVDTTGGQMIVTDEPATFQPTSTDSKGLGFINNRMTDFFDNLIVVHGSKGSQTFHPEQEIYLTKAGSPIKVQFSGTKVTGIAGSAQMERGTFIPVKEDMIFDQTEAGNGVSYVLDSIPSTTLTAPYDILHDTISHPDFSLFATLIGPSSSIISKNFGSADYPYINYGINILSKYHYTIYVPQNDKIQELIDKHKLPTIEEYDEWQSVIDSAKVIKDIFDSLYTDFKNSADKDDEVLKQQWADRETLENEKYDSIETKAKSCMAFIDSVQTNFVRYHIQDGSIYLGGEQTSNVYETAAYDEATSLFRRLNVGNSGSAITVTDARGKVANVVAGDHSNLVSRQYAFNKNRWIYSSAYVVVHTIDNVLLYSDDQLLPDGFPKPTYPVADFEVKRK
ncbi:MAG: fasciclin domain-containing protein [Bacteroidaceae bacterium]|nr:fasciclin domain-containing protein [Bacteroidaceae bacterium]